MTNTQKRQRLERAKAHEQMRQSGKKHQEGYFDKKERLEKHYGYYIDPDDFAARDHRSDMDFWAWQDEMDGWKKFAEKHVTEAEKAHDEYYVDEKMAWLAIFSHQMRVLAPFRRKEKTADITTKYETEKFYELDDEYWDQIVSMSDKTLAAYPPYCDRPNRGDLIYKTKSGETLVTPNAIIAINKTSARRLCLLIKTCLDKHILDAQSIHYLQAIDDGKKAPEFKGKIDTKDLRLYSTLLDSLKVARIIGGQDKGIAKRIESLGARFLTAKDLKSLQKIKPTFDTQRILMMKKKFAENRI